MELLNKACSERNRLAGDALAALSKFIATPERGYVAEPHMLAADIERLGNLMNTVLEKWNAELRKKTELAERVQLLEHELIAAKHEKVDGRNLDQLRADAEALVCGISRAEKALLGQKSRELLQRLENSFVVYVVKAEPEQPRSGAV